MRSDAEIIQLLRSNDPDAFVALYERYKQDVFHYAYHILMDRDLAAEAAQETFTKALTGLGGLQHPDRAKAWLMTIARNVAYGLTRKQKSLRLSDDEVWVSDSPFDQYEVTERQQLVRHYLAQLKPEYREALTLVEYEGLSYAEIAERTSSSISAVQSRIFRARRALAAKLAPFVKERNAS